MKANSGFKGFFDSIIDYAGLFPPADLSLRSALKNYQRYLLSEESWLLSSFVCPVARFSEIESSDLELFSREFPLKISALSADLEADSKFVDEFFKRAQGKATLFSIETGLSDGDDFSSLIQSLLSGVDKFPDVEYAFVECKSANNWNEYSQNIISSLSENQNSSSTKLAFKLRCGGLSVPSAQQIVQCLLDCSQKKLPLKFTAGLHHPFRCYDADLACKTHGFFNVFFTAALIFHGERDQAALQAVIEEEDALVDFSGNSLKWLGFEVSCDQMKSLRAESAISFGSCSFEEPVEDASKLGWIS